MKVYVVEDSDAICERIVRMVNEIKNADVVGTTDMVSSAIRGIEKCLPDVVILDIQLLDGNGFTVLQYIKEKMLAIKVIVLTNFNSDQYRNLAQRYGADAFLDKSNDFMQIPGLLQSWQSSSPGAIHSANQPVNSSSPQKRK
jgi:DNA-binding NarL/FixJ family response regulator